MLLRTLTATLALLVSLSAAAYTIDGDLTDWNINKDTYISGKTLKGYSKDLDSTGTDQVFPGWGGQAYDAEALYVDMDSSTLYLAMITGHNPAWKNETVSGVQMWAPGDFLIDFDRDGSFEYGIKTTGDFEGWLFRVVASDLQRGLFVKGPDNFNRDAVSILDNHGTKVGAAAGMLKTSGPFTGYGAVKGDEHYAYEASIDINLFDRAFWGKEFDVQWAMQCGNDVIWADPPGGIVPEPMSLALFGIAFAGLGLSRRRSKPAA